MRLETPEITRIFAVMRRLGADVPASVYTVEEAVRVLEEKRHA